MNLTSNLNARKIEDHKGPDSFDIAANTEALIVGVEQCVEMFLS